MSDEDETLKIPAELYDKMNPLTIKFANAVREESFSAALEKAFGTYRDLGGTVRSGVFEMIFRAGWDARGGTK